jgi:polyisoprenoid-binding protein YceI
MVKRARRCYRRCRATTTFEPMKTSNPESSPRWILDPMDTTVMFSVRHFLITNVHGFFEAVRGTVRYDRRRPARTEMRIEIPAASIHTRQAQRDYHLRNADFFDADAHPIITFESTRIGVVDGRVAEIAGALTIRGITREVVLTMHEITGEQIDHNRKVRIGASATAHIRRSEFGMTYNMLLESGGLAISDEVALRFDVSLIKDDEHD